MKTFLKIGAAAGAAGGAALALFLVLVGERSIRDAIALEHQRAAAAAAAAVAGGAPEPAAHHEMFSRAVQQVGGGLGALVYGVMIGLVFAVVLATVRHRLVGGTDWHRAMKVASAGFVGLFLVPFAKYPANPPAVGDPATITRRTVLYLCMLAWSFIAIWAGWRMLRWRRDGRDRPVHTAVPAAVATWAAIVAVAYVFLPGSPDRLPADVPASLLWRFRLATVGGSTFFWTVLGLTAGTLLMRAENRTGGQSGRQNDHFDRQNGVV